MKNNQNLFFSPEEKGRAFSDVLKEVQEYISSKYSTLMVEGGSEEVKQQVKRYITKYICDYRITVKGKTQEQLIDDLYTEMAEFSFLTKYIFGTGIEEIDINSWRDIEIQYNDGRCEKLEEHFESPEHAVNVIRRMLHVSGMVLDNASPAVLGHLSKNIRIAVLKTPLVDEDVGIAASIRIVNPDNKLLCDCRTYIKTSTVRYFIRDTELKKASILYCFCTSVRKNDLHLIMQYSVVFNCFFICIRCRNHSVTSV